MIITDVVPLVLGTPWRNLIFLKLETDEGLVGVSEARSVNRTEDMPSGTPCASTPATGGEAVFARPMDSVTVGMTSAFDRSWMFVPLEVTKSAYPVFTTGPRWRAATCVENVIDAEELAASIGKPIATSMAVASSPPVR